MEFGYLVEDNGSSATQLVTVSRPGAAVICGVVSSAAHTLPNCHELGPIQAPLGHTACIKQQRDTRPDTAERATPLPPQAVVLRIDRSPLDEFDENRGHIPLVVMTSDDPYVAPTQKRARPAAVWRAMHEKLCVAVE
jgi:hypothetical protein